MKPSKASSTAERVALTRAIESLRPENERICFDPLARHFLGRRIRRIHRYWLLRRLFCYLSERRFPGVMGAVLLRTRYMDDHLKARLSDGIRQVVNLGAGYDTRAFRLQSEFHRANVFEVDHPATQERKIAALESNGLPVPPNLVFVPVRFNEENLIDRLLSAGCRTGEKTAFLWEGVTYYLAAEAVNRVLGWIAGSFPAGSSIVFDFMPPSVADGSCGLKEARSMRARFAALGEQLTFGVSPEQMPAFLSERGYRRTSVVSCLQLKKNLQSQSKHRLKVSGLFNIAQAEV